MENSSFRDPDGFVYIKNGVLYRQLNSSYKEAYDKLLKSGLFELLTSKKMLVDHCETDLALAYDTENVYKVLEPELVPYISYPYEWCFEQYKKAALLTLDLHISALEHGMILKDASAYNIQFIGSSPIFIDTSSLDIYQPGQSWDAYGQFCRHFLAPLVLMSSVNTSLSRLMQVHIDGIPLDLAVSILKGRKKFNLAVMTHLYMHARQQSRAENGGGKVKRGKIPKHYLRLIADNLRSCIKGLRLTRRKTKWCDYYETMHNYSDNSLEDKSGIVREFLQRINPEKICDLGANNGKFSMIAGELKDSYVISSDMDHNAVNELFMGLEISNSKNILPLMLDLTSPSPSVGWASVERMSFNQRADFDCVMALALCHHLAISNNVPLGSIAKYFSELCRHLIIEFVPKSDSQIKKMLLNRKDIFFGYDQANFELEFKKYFHLVDKKCVFESDRNVYLFSNKKN